ncbi:MAG: hypothetical protein WAO28_01545 [Candidatus Microsaccharimonas sp.]
MQDIDFDELDRAVSSTLSPTRPSNTEKTDAVPVGTPDSATPRPVAPAARRSSGRFMDVVHPSSDMRPAERPERSAPRPPEPVQQQPERSAPATTDWPDPLDFHGFKDEPEAEAPKPEPEPVSNNDDASSTPLESPFLTDAKVEKRPLGAFSANDTPSLSDQIDAENAAEIAPIEAEDVPLLEAPDEELLTAETETKDEPPVVPEVPVEEKKPEVEELTEEVSKDEPTPVTAIEEPTGPQSITQQYKEQPSSNQTSGAIYDTEAYHQPLVHTAKKKSGALVVIWILALILVGAGAGAGIYFFVLPML